MQRTLFLAPLLALAACGSGGTVVESAGDRTPSAAPTATPTRATSPALPDGWRWEAYRGVQVAVPGDWTWINGSQRESQWCVGDTLGPKRPRGIGRPGAATEVGCFGRNGEIPRSTLVAENGVFAAFGGADTYPKGVEGDRLTVHVGDVAVLIQTDPTLRRAIAATAHAIDVDANGCPQRDGVTDDPALKPAPAVALDDLVDVEAVASCLYAVREQPGFDGPSLYSSVRIVGRSATDALAALAQAPAAGGQDEPQNCVHKYGDELLVLLVDSAAGRSRVHVRFSGCDHNGADDGVTVRRLTPALLPFFSGGNRPSGFSGGAGKSEAIVGAGNGRVPEPTGPPTD